MMLNRAVMCAVPVLLAAGTAGCDDPVRVQACGLVMRNGNVQLHSTQGAVRLIEIPEAQVIDSINTGRWETRCDR